MQSNRLLVVALNDQTKLSRSQHCVIPCNANAHQCHTSAADFSKPYLTEPGYMMEDGNILS